MREKMSPEPFEEIVRREGPEVELERYNVYLKNLGITSDDLRGKSILDVGAGRMRFFATHVLREKLTDNIFSLDPNVSVPAHMEGEKLWKEMDKEIQDDVRAHTIRAVGEAIPLKDKSMDLVLANCFPRSDHSGRFEEAALAQKEIEDLFEEFVRVLVPGGEMRYYGLRRYDEPWRDPAATNWRQGIMKKLANLKKKGFEVLVEEVERDQKEDKSWTFWDRIVVRKPGS